MILKLDGKRFYSFSNYNLGLNYNSIADSFSFSALRDFAPDPFGYQKCEILTDNNELLITGTIITEDFAATSKEQLINVQGYSLPGVLEDSQLPVSLYPMQNDKLTLKELIDKVISPFSLEYLIDPIVSAEFSKTYEKSNVEQGESIKDYINRLVSQKGIILTHNEKGQIVFTKLQIGSLTPVATFEEGNPGIFEASLSLNSQAMHQSITVLRQASKKSPKALQSTISNPYCNVARYKTKILSSDSGDLTDVDKAARNELGAELEAGVKLTIKTTQFVKPGNLIKFKSPKLRINSLTDFFVQGCSIDGDVRGEKYTLTCVLKDVYTDEDPVNIFDDQILGSSLPKF